MAEVKTKNTLPNKSSLYEEDFVAWTDKQAALLRHERWQELDLVNLIEEVRDLGNALRRELKSRLRVLLGHLLKWQHQPQKRSNSWMSTIREQREEIKELLERNPSLKPIFALAVIETYQKGIHLAVQETNLPYEAFPQVCPYTEEQVLAEGFWG